MNLKNYSTFDQNDANNK